MEEDAGGSLFEGMVLFTDLDIHHNDTQQSPSLSSPLSEDLFSDLTIQIDDEEQQSSFTPPRLSTQIRKKKRAVRIGYARQDSSSSILAQDPEDEDDGQIQMPVEEQEEDELQQHKAGGQYEVKEQEKFELQATAEEEDGRIHSRVEEQEKEEELQQAADDQEMVEKAKEEMDIDLIRAQISKKRDLLLQRAASVSAERKELVRKQRLTLRSFNAASSRFKELEKELEQACESEEFEKAENVSHDLASAEKERDDLLVSLRDIESQCQSAESKMQDILNLQIALDEECATLLQQFSKEAADQAESVLKIAEMETEKELEKWQSSLELVETKKLEIDIELQIVSETHTEMENAIDNLVADDRKVKEILTTEGEILAKELDDLLELVRLKEKEIAENEFKLQDVDGRIASVVSEFHTMQYNVDMKHRDLQESFSKIESERLSLLNNKKGIDEIVLSAEQKKKKLMEISSVSSDEAQQHHNLVSLKKGSALAIAKSRDDRVSFARTEEKINEDIQLLKQQISDRRTALQELSSARASIQQEVASHKQRIVFVEKRGPELEAEKKIAAAARNFKEAARVAAEAKTLNVEKEDLQHKMEKASLELQRLEKEIMSHVDNIQESEDLISLKEKEAAMAGYKRLLLEAAAARAESSATRQMGDEEEGDILMNEAEIAESKARELQEQYGIEPELDEINYVSLAFITNHSGNCLSGLASLKNPEANGS